MPDLKTDAIEYHKRHKGKIATQVLEPITSKDDLSLAYTPGVGLVSKEVYENAELAYNLTIKAHTVAVVSDGSAVLGLGNIGPLGALPVMEGKCALFKTFANIDAFPICLATQKTEEIIQTVKNIAPVFGGINLEDISAPRCFEVEDALQDLGIPVMHDDQHGTAVVALAGLINAAKVAQKQLNELIVVISGAGAAGNAITNLIVDLVKEIRICDSKGVIYAGRSDLDLHKEELSKITNKNSLKGSLQEMLVGADVFMGVSAPNLLTAKDIKVMANRAIVFAMANPIPEIMPEEAKKGGAYIVATGRSDFPNQINNSLAFPGIFKGALQSRATKITMEMKRAAAYALAKLVLNPTADKIIPGPFEKGIVEAVANSVSDLVASN